MMVSSLLCEMDVIDVIGHWSLVIYMYNNIDHVGYLQKLIYRILLYVFKAIIAELSLSDRASSIMPTAVITGANSGL